MAIDDWVADSTQRVRRNGVQGAKDSLYQVYLGLVRQTNRFFPEGTNVLDEEWDLLLILDGCRCDAIASVADEYKFLSNEDSIRSVASTSGEWMQKTFTSDRRRETEQLVHVTANPHSDADLDESAFHTLNEVWRYGWDDDTGTIPAETVTDVAIDAGRETAGDRSRMVVHYMQPHFPSVPDPIGEADITNARPEQNVWRMLQRGEVSEERVWQSYLENLRYVLDSVELLLENIDADTVVISADHGNAKGEWGVYEHPHEMPHEAIREVPWYLTTAEDTGSYEPETERTTDTEDERSVEEHLKALGYA